MLTGDLKMSALDARRLKLSNELIELDRLAPWIEGLDESGMSSNMSFAVQVCLEEVVANIIMYGATEDERLQITLELERSDAMLLARISDNGREFDPTQAPSPTVAASLEDAKVGNLGIHLVRGFANGVDYERRAGCNQPRLRFIEPQERAREQHSYLVGVDRAEPSIGPTPAGVSCLWPTGAGCDQITLSDGSPSAPLDIGN
jgi:anti-sigma regulatory factor (Ser/Thr protein kinase)